MNEAQPQRFAEWVQAAVDQHGPALTRFAASIVGDEDSARDVVQDTFLRLCEAPPEALDGRLAAWLFTVCRHRALDLRHKLQRMKPLTDEELEDQAGAAPSPDSLAEREDDLAVALRLLAALPPNQQEVVRLKFQAGLSYQEISEVTSLSVSNVGFLLHTALKSLRARASRSL